MDSIKKSILIAVERRNLLGKNSNEIKLRDYQNEAIAAWIKNQYLGFFIMATGTGKTWTAIYSLKKLYEQNKVLTIIACPYKHLVKQWSDDIKKTFPNAIVILVSSENPKWYSDARKFIIPQTRDDEKQIILITTIKSFYTENFNNLISWSKKDKILIVDEAHRFTQRSDDLKNIYKYRLGLSATPFNGKNANVGDDIINFFGGLAYSFPIEKALERGFLVPYTYTPLFINPTEEEENSFNRITRKMANCFVNGVLVDKDRLLKYAKARMRILATAEEKNNNLSSIIQQIGSKKNFIIYCGDGRICDINNSVEIRHIDYVKKQVSSLGFKASQFTAQENMQRRSELVNMFNENEINCLVAIRCLDEGINIPSIKTALILSSNDDYREFVQRRGRILRTYKGKNHADIYDVIVKPFKSKSMALIEFRRYYEYAKLASNSKDLLSKLESYLVEYNIDWDEITSYSDNVSIERELDD